MKKTLFRSLMCVIFSLTAAKGMIRTFEDQDPQKSSHIFKKKKLDIPTAHDLVIHAACQILPEDIENIQESIYGSECFLHTDIKPILKEAFKERQSEPYKKLTIKEKVREDGMIEFLIDFPIHELSIFPENWNISPTNYTFNPISYLKVHSGTIVNSLTIGEYTRAVIKYCYHPDKNENFKEYIDSIHACYFLSHCNNNYFHHVSNLNIAEPITGFEVQATENQTTNPFVIIFALAPGVSLHTMLKNETEEFTNNILCTVARYFSEFHYHSREKGLDQQSATYKNIINYHKNNLRVFLNEKTYHYNLWTKFITNSEDRKRFIVYLEDIINNYNNFLFPTITHGDSHGENIFIKVNKSTKIKESGWSNFCSLVNYYCFGKQDRSQDGLLFSAVEQVTLIDCETMSGSKDATADVGRLVGTVWRSEANDIWDVSDVEELYHRFLRAQKRQNIIIRAYERGLLNAWSIYNKKFKKHFKKTINIDEEDKYSDDFLRDICFDMFEIEKNIIFYRNCFFKSLLNFKEGAEENTIAFKKKLMALWLNEIGIDFKEKSPECTNDDSFPNSNNRTEGNSGYFLTKEGIVEDLFAPLLNELSHSSHEKAREAAKLGQEKLKKILEAGNTVELEESIDFVQNLKLSLEGLKEKIRNDILEDKDIFQKKNYINKLSQKKQTFSEFIDCIYELRNSIYFNILKSHETFFKNEDTCSQCKRESINLGKVMGCKVGNCWVCGHEEFVLERQNNNSMDVQNSQEPTPEGQGTLEGILSTEDNNLQITLESKQLTQPEVPEDEKRYIEIKSQQQENGYAAELEQQQNMTSLIRLFNDQKHYLAVEWQHVVSQHLEQCIRSKFGTPKTFTPILSLEKTFLQDGTIDDSQIMDVDQKEPLILPNIVNPFPSLLGF